ncbi:MAG: glutamate cyclase domain-containing protein [Pseudomonadota bacterium]
MNDVHFERLSVQIEDRLVALNPRGMGTLRPHLRPGYCLRSAQILLRADSVLIGTGFPVAGTFETDGPVGALALLTSLEALGKTVTLACADPLATALEADFPVLRLEAFNVAAGRQEATTNLSALKPEVVVSIERPGLCADDRYYNMRGEDISAHCAVFDYYLSQANCPTLAIGDGGNEIGMGKVSAAVEQLAVKPVQTSCEELVVADISNWGAYGVIALMQALSATTLLDSIDHRGLLEYLSARGSVDGITREKTLTEDGMDCEVGERLLADLAAMIKHESWLGDYSQANGVTL